MKVVLVLAPVFLAAVSGLASGGVAVSMTMVAADVRTAEPALLLMSGTVLLAIAGAVRRYTV